MWEPAEGHVTLSYVCSLLLQSFHPRVCPAPLCVGRPSAYRISRRAWLERESTDNHYTIVPFPFRLFPERIAITHL